MRALIVDEVRLSRTEKVFTLTRYTLPLGRVLHDTKEVANSPDPQALAAAARLLSTGEFIG